MAENEKRYTNSVFSKYLAACSDETISARCIFACDKNGIIGYDNDLIFFNKKDLAFFKQKTMGGIVVMGHNTFRSLGYRPLPGRVNLVMIRKHYPLPDVPMDKKHWFRECSLPNNTYFAVITTPDAILRYAKTFEIKNVWIIGGAFMFDWFFDHCNSTVETVYNCDLLTDGVRLGLLPPDFDPEKLVQTRYRQLMKRDCLVVDSDYFHTPSGEEIKYYIKSRRIHITKKQQAAQKMLSRSDFSVFADLANSTQIEGFKPTD